MKHNVWKSLSKEASLPQEPYYFQTEAWAQRGTQHRECVATESTTALGHSTQGSAQYQRYAVPLRNLLLIAMLACCCLAVLLNRISTEMTTLVVDEMESQTVDFDAIFAEESISEAAASVYSETTEVTTSAYGETMDEIVGNLRYLSYEVAVGFDRNGDFLFEQTNGKVQKVRIDLKQLDGALIEGGVILLHNHPSDVPFSVSDLMSANNFSAPVIVVVSPSYTYLMYEPSAGWPADSEVKQWGEVMKRNESLWTMRSSWSVITGTTYYRQTTDWLMEAFAEEFGATYLCYSSTAKLSEILEIED